MSNTYQALNIPPAANERGGFEILRCAIVEGELHLTLRPVFNEPNDWGRLFAEVAMFKGEAFPKCARCADAVIFSKVREFHGLDAAGTPSFRVPLLELAVIEPLPDPVSAS